MLGNLKRWAAVTALTVMAASAALAADVNGKWTWTVKAGQNEFTQTAELKQDGEKLTGTVTGPNDQKREIKDGTVKGDEIAWVVIYDRDGQELKVNYKGKLEGEEIKGKLTATVNGEERSREWTAKRPK